VWTARRLNSWVAEADRFGSSLGSTRATRKSATASILEIGRETGQRVAVP